MTVFLAHIIVADNKILGQSLLDLGSSTYAGTLLTDKYAKVAREIVHDASKFISGVL